MGNNSKTQILRSEVDKSTSRGTVFCKTDTGIAIEVSFKPGFGGILAGFEITAHIEEGQARIVLTGNRLIKAQDGSPVIAQGWNKTIQGVNVSGFTANTRPNIDEMREALKKYNVSDDDLVKLLEIARGMKRRPSSNGSIRTFYNGACGMGVGLNQLVFNAYNEYLQALQAADTEESLEVPEAETAAIAEVENSLELETF